MICYMINYCSLRVRPIIGEFREEDRRNHHTGVVESYTVFVARGGERYQRDCIYVSRLAAEAILMGVIRDKLRDMNSQVEFLNSALNELFA